MPTPSGLNIERGDHGGNLQSLRHPGDRPHAAQRGDRVQDRPLLPARAGRGGPRERQHGGGQPRHARAQRGAAEGPGARAHRLRARRARHRPLVDADELLRDQPFQGRRRRAGDGEPQPGGVQRLQVQPPRRPAGLRRPRHRADGEGGPGGGSAQGRHPRQGDAGRGLRGLQAARPLLPARGELRPHAQGRGRRRQRHGHDRPADPGGAGDRSDDALLRARRHLPQPRGEPAQGGEPARPPEGGARGRRPTSASPSTATPTAPRSSTRPARRSAAT